MGAASMLPEAFAQWEPFAADWCLGSEAARREQRMHSTQPQLEKFYKAVKPRLDEAIQYLNGFPVNDLPPREQNLLHLHLVGIDAVGGRIEIEANANAVLLRSDQR